MQLVECVPNFSEGRNTKIIDQIVQSIAKVGGVHVFDVDSNGSANRTVVTFVGPPKAVSEAAFNAMAAAHSLIDMSKHKGAHPRIGGTDVCPLVPISGLSMEDCIALSHKLAGRVAEELEIPVYLYANSAQIPERVRLAYIRKGQYENLEKRMDQGFIPDYGRCSFNAKAGATAIGARDLLIAFNINLATKSSEIAAAIAAQIRSNRRGQHGESVAPECFEPERVDAFKFELCTAIGWYIEEYERAQVSMNIMDFRTSPLHRVFLEVKSLANRHGVEVTGSEVVGLVPLEPLLQSGRYYLKKSENNLVEEKPLVDAAVRLMNLSDSKPFDPERKILDYRLRTLSVS